MRWSSSGIRLQMLTTALGLFSQTKKSTTLMIFTSDIRSKHVHGCTLGDLTTSLLSNGKNLSGGTVQGALLSRPEVKGALIVGQARFEPATMIEPRLMHDLRSNRFMHDSLEAPNRHPRS